MFSSLYIKSLFALIFICGILYLFLKLLQKYSPIGNQNLTGNKNTEININSVTYIDHESKIVNFSCKNKKYLILISKNNNMLIDSYIDE